jgi:hypothetical protein
LRPLERGAFLLEPTQHLLPRQALLLERSPGLGERGSLLLELGLRLLARGSLLTELLIRCGERGSLSRQGCPQPLSLLGLLLSLTLPGPHPSRAARSCWSWPRAEATSASHTAATVRPPPGLRALCAARHPAPPALSSPSRPRRRPPRPVGWSSWESARYTNHRSGDLRASTRASRELYCPRYQLRSASRRSRVSYLAQGRRSKSCRQWARREKTGSGKARTRKKAREETTKRNKKPC